MRIYAGGIKLAAVFVDHCAKIIVKKENTKITGFEVPKVAIITSIGFHTPVKIPAVIPTIKIKAPTITKPKTCAIIALRFLIKNFSFSKFLSLFNCLVKSGLLSAIVIHPPAIPITANING